MRLKSNIRRALQQPIPEAPSAPEMQSVTEPDMPALAPPALGELYESSMMTSAPPSRGSDHWELQDRIPSKVTLSRDQLQIASICGLSPVEYARNLIEMERLKRSGDLQQ